MPEILEEAVGLHSDPEGGPDLEENVSVQQVRAKRKQTEALLQTLSPVRPAEEDILLAIILATYTESMPANLLLIPSTTVVKETIARVRTAGEEESTWWRTMVVEYIQQVRAARRQTDQDVQERTRKRSLDMAEEGDRTKRHKGTQEVISPGPNTKAHKGQGHAPHKSPRTLKPAHKVEEDPRRKDKWVVGTGKAQATVQRLVKRNDRLKPVSITEINDVDPMGHPECAEICSSEWGSTSRTSSPWRGNMARS